MSDLAQAMQEMKPAMEGVPPAVQEKAVSMAIELAIKGAIASEGRIQPNAASDFWAIFLELFKMLLPILLELLKGGI